MPMELQYIKINLLKHRVHLHNSRIDKQSNQRARTMNYCMDIPCSLRRHMTSACSMKHAANGISAEYQSLISVLGPRDAADLDAHGLPPS